MNFRTYRFYGHGYATTDSAAVMVFFNGEQIYTGAVPTKPMGDFQETEADPVILFQAGIDITRTGNLPLKIIVTKGLIKFTHVEANYSGCKIDNIADVVAFEVETSGAGDPEYYKQFQFAIKPVDYWSSPNLGDSRKNVTFNGVPYVQSALPGDWQYTIGPGVTFQCDVHVHPDKVVTDESPYHGVIRWVDNLSPNA
jgi:hypothetical protein